MISFTGCEENKDDEIQLEGIYIVNEGQFNNNNGSISLLDPETNAVSQNYFQQQNSRSLGDIVQDLSFYKDRGFIVVNNSKKIEIVDKQSFETIGVIGNLSYPRQFEAISDSKGYLTNGTSANGENGHVLVTDLENYTVIDSIEVGKGPESLIKLDNKVFVTNAGGYSVGNTISVINTSTDKVVETIEVANVPSDIVKDKNNNIWVYCKGDLNWDTYNYENAKIIKINADNYETQDFSIGTLTSFGNYNLSPG